MSRMSELDLFLKEPSRIHNDGRPDGIHVHVRAKMYTTIKTASTLDQLDWTTTPY